MKYASFLAVFCLFVGNTLAEEEWSGESVDCHDIAGTYSTIYEQTVGTLGNYGVSQAWKSSSPTYSGVGLGALSDFAFGPATFNPDLVGRVTFDNLCRVCLHFNIETFEDRRRSMVTNSTKRWVQRLNRINERRLDVSTNIAAYSNGDLPFGIDFSSSYSTFPSGQASYYFLCGEILTPEAIALDIDTDDVFNAPNFEITSSASDSGDLDGSYCTVHDDDTINCSFQFQTIKGLNTNFRAVLYRRSDDIDDDLVTITG